jgi:PAS domain S-box-containing protein
MQNQTPPFKNCKEHNCSLKTSSDYSLSIIEAIRDPLFTINLEGIITDINLATIRVTEVAPEKLIGSSFINYFSNKAKAKKAYKQVFSDGYISDFPLTITDGELTEVLFNGSVYKDNEGKVIGAVVVARDISVQKKLKKN